MPGFQRKYKKTYKPKSNYRKKKSFSGGGYMNIAKQALRTANFVANLVNVEHKYKDTSISALAVFNAGWGIDALNLIAEGDDMTDRNGRSIKATDLDLRMQIELNTGLANCIIRVMLIRDNANAGAAPTMTDIIAGAAGSDQIVNQFRNVLTGATHRYDILMDKRIAIDAAKSSQASLVKHFKLDSHIRYIGTTAALTSNGNGSLYLAYISTGGVAADGVLLTHNTRLKFIDN